VTIAILIGDVADVSYEIDTDQARRPNPDRKYLVSCLRDVTHDPWFHDFVIFPLAVILLDDLREHLLKIRWTDI
jgi:hypothetical protein